MRLRKTIAEQLGVDPDPDFNPAKERQPRRPPKTEAEHLGLDTPAHLPGTRWPASQAEPGGVAGLGARAMTPYRP